MLYKLLPCPGEKSLGTREELYVSTCLSEFYRRQQAETVLSKGLEGKGHTVPSEHTASLLQLPRGLGTTVMEISCVP